MLSSLFSREGGPRVCGPPFHSEFGADVVSVREWGEKILVDLTWQGPKRLSLNRLPRTIPGHRGVYLISSRKGLYPYPRGHSSLAYIGSGRMGNRLSAHVGRNDDLIDLVGAEGTMWFWYASVPRGWHPCVEQVLFDEFEERHGSHPVLNKVRPPCDLDWRNIRVKHSNLSFPYDFSRRDFP